LTPTPLYNTIGLDSYYKLRTTVMDGFKRGIMVRTNTRIFPDQDKFIKKLAKETKVGIGAAHRMMIDQYINDRTPKK
jgi:hypothetical protein